MTDTPGDMAAKLEARAVPQNRVHERVEDQGTALADYTVLVLASDLRAAASMLCECAEREKWLPIETAPTEPVVGEYSPPRVALWVPNHGPTYGRFQDNRFAKKPRPFWRYESGLGDLTIRENQPTHWRPLPAPPEAK